jgi:hypothetical protein
MQRTKRDRHGENLVSWLNATGGTKILLAMLDRAKRMGERHDLLSLPPDAQEHDKAFRAFGEFQTNLMRFRFRPFVRFYTGSKWEFAWECRRGNSKWVHTGDPHTEAAALLNLLRLAETKELPRVRKCHCGRWFLARKSDQEFCSTRCRQKAFSATGKFKQRRRAYMRNYYRLKKSGKVK